MKNENVVKKEELEEIIVEEYVDNGKVKATDFQFRDNVKSKMKQSFFNIEKELERLGQEELLAVDIRSLALAITNLQTAQMWAVRSLYSKDEIHEH